LADIYFKQYLAGKNATFNRLALHHAQKALDAKPGDFNATAAYYKIMYTQVREEGAPETLARLKKYYANLPAHFRVNFFPPTLAFYLFQIEHTANERSGAKNQELKTLLLDALKEQPRNPLIHLQLSRYYFDANQIEVAFAMLKHAYRLEPTNTQVLLALADSYRTRAQRSACVYDNLDDIKASSQFYKQLLSQQATDAQIHWGLMVDYAHLGLAPLSLREGEQFSSAQANPAYRWVWATFLTYQGQAEKAETVFAAARAQLQKVPSRALVEHHLLRGQWKQAGTAFTDYIASNERPGVTDLLLASMIEAESQDKSLTIASLWRTEKKAAFFSRFDEALAKFWRGELDEAQFAKEVENSCQQSQYDFYVGYLNLLNNRVAKAREHLEKVGKQPQPMQFEVRMATQFLHELLSSRKPAK
jgi:Tfp pilus assembly protein PilF